MRLTDFIRSRTLIIFPLSIRAHTRIHARTRDEELTRLRYRCAPFVSTMYRIIYNGIQACAARSFATFKTTRSNDFVRTCISINERCTMRLLFKCPGDYRRQLAWVSLDATSSFVSFNLFHFELSSKIVPPFRRPLIVGFFEYPSRQRFSHTSLGSDNTLFLSDSRRPREENYQKEFFITNRSRLDLKRNSVEFGSLWKVESKRTKVDTFGRILWFLRAPERPINEKMRQKKGVLPLALPLDQLRPSHRSPPLLLLARSNVSHMTFALNVSGFRKRIPWGILILWFFLFTGKVEKC